MAKATTRSDKKVRRSEEKYDLQVHPHVSHGEEIIRHNEEVRHGEAIFFRSEEKSKEKMTSMFATKKKPSLRHRSAG